VSLSPHKGQSLCARRDDGQREAKLISGRTLAYTRVNFYTPDEKLVAFGSHTKYMGSAKATTSFSADGEKETAVDEKAKL